MKKLDVLVFFVSPFVLVDVVVVLMNKIPSGYYFENSTIVAAASGAAVTLFYFQSLSDANRGKYLGRAFAISFLGIIAGLLLFARS